MTPELFERRFNQMNEIYNALWNGDARGLTATDRRFLDELDRKKLRAVTEDEWKTVEVLHARLLNARALS